MFAFRLWGQFAVFRDPLTITQNLSLPMPPKTTVGGIMAAILGIDYNDYFNDEDYFNFEYSLVMESSLRKASFAQNYIHDYTKEAAKKEKTFLDFYFSYTDLLNRSQQGFEELDNKDIENFNKKFDAYMEKRMAQFTKPKPIYREIILNPQYLIIINDYKYEDKIIRYLKNHESEYSVYLGNSEFAGNFEMVPIEAGKTQGNKLDSFTVHPDNIKYESGKKYTPVYSACKVVGNREYRDYKKVILCNDQMVLNKKVSGYLIKANGKELFCEFI